MTAIDEQTGEIVEWGEESEAVVRHNRFIKLGEIAAETFLHIGEELYWIRKRRLWLDLKSDSFEAYLAQYSGIEYRVAMMLISVFEKYILELKVKPVSLLEAGYSKLYTVRKKANSDNVEDVIANASRLSRSDLRIEYGLPVKEPPPPKRKPNLTHDHMPIFRSDLSERVQGTWLEGEQRMRLILEIMPQDDESCELCGKEWATDRHHAIVFASDLPGAKYRDFINDKKNFIDCCRSCHSNKLQRNRPLGYDFLIKKWGRSAIVDWLKEFEWKVWPPAKQAVIVKGGNLETEV